MKKNICWGFIEQFERNRNILYVDKDKYPVLDSYNRSAI